MEGHMESPGPPILLKAADLSRLDLAAAADGNSPQPPVLEKYDQLNGSGNQTAPQLKNVKRKPKAGFQTQKKNSRSPRVTRSRKLLPPPPLPTTTDEGEAKAENTLRIVTTPESPPPPVTAGEDIEGITTQEILGQDIMTEAELFMNPETGYYGNAYLHPELIDCEDAITPAMIQRLAHPQARKALLEIFQSVGIHTIGDLSRQTEIDVVKWPLIQPKFETTRMILEEYQTARHEEVMALFNINRTIDLTENSVEADLVPPTVEVANLKLTSTRKKKKATRRIPKSKPEVIPDQLPEEAAAVNGAPEMMENEQDKVSVPLESMEAEVDAEEVMQFLQSGDEMQVQEFLDDFLSDPAVMETVLQRLMERNDFEKRVWTVSGTKFFKNPPMALCDSLMTQEASANYEARYERELNFRVPRNFWGDTLRILGTSFAQTYRQVVKTEGNGLEGQELQMGPEILDRLQMGTWTGFLERASTLHSVNEVGPLNTKFGDLSGIATPPPSPPEGNASAPQSPAGIGSNPATVEEILESLKGMSEEDRTTVLRTFL